MESSQTTTLRCVGTIEGGGYDKMLEMNRRVYDTKGTSPTLMVNREKTIRLVKEDAEERLHKDR